MLHFSIKKLNYSNHQKNICYLFCFLVVFYLSAQKKRIEEKTNEEKDKIPDMFCFLVEQYKKTAL